MSSKKIIYCILLSTFFLFLTSCSKNPKMDLLEAVLLPKPVSVVASGNSFEFKSSTKIMVKGDTESFLKTGQFLADLIKPATGFNLEVISTSEEPTTNRIYLEISELESEFGKEGYILNITKKNVRLRANSPEGIVRGIQTLRQILPKEIESDSYQQKSWFIATGEIRDYPQYEYRGSMLDVSRHFFRVEDVKKYIDILAMYKMNVLHLHLSDDQGWRIEIKSWPNLTAYGGSTQVGGGKGGYYTQEEYKEIVQYAAERYITIVPEIDMPGHTNAALASYAELNCNDETPELYTGTSVGFSSLCIDKEITYQFINDVVRELAAMTPGPYIHIGGDESHVTPLEDYIPFINKVQDIVLSHGKQMIGWDEIALADLKTNGVVQFWANSKNALKGVAKNAKVIVSPANRCYLDMKYDSITKLGLNWAGYIEVDQAYNWSPSNYVSGISKKDILGIESPLWTETVTNMDEIEFMVFPRIIGHAEIGWTPDSLRIWNDYKLRLKKHAKRLKIMDINYYASDLIHGDDMETKE